MQPRNRYTVVIMVLGAAIILGWFPLMNYLYPPAKKVAPKDAVALVAGGMGWMGLEVEAPKLEAEARIKEDEQKQADLEKQAKREEVMALTGSMVAPFDFVRSLRRVPPSQAKSTLIAMGQGSKPYHLQVLLNSRGGTVQQVVLSHFQHADREGLALTKTVDGKTVPVPLHLVPGFEIPREGGIRSQRGKGLPELLPGLIDDWEIREHRSYALYHYEKQSDPAPVTTLGEEQWEIVKNEANADNTAHEVIFEHTLGAPYFIKIQKIFTLKRAEYHIGMRVKITPHLRPEGAKIEPFRYQITGSRDLPLEGEWYSSVYRQGIIGYQSGSSSSRILLEPAKVRQTDGSEREASNDKKMIRFTGTMIQYFASVMAVDNVQVDDGPQNFVDAVRFTPVGKTNKEKEFLDDFTPRLIAKPVEAETADHGFILYQGPVKVRLLKQLKGEQEVPEETVDRYRDQLSMHRLTDAPMDNFIGRVANFICWTDIVIAFTNLIHSIMGLLSFNPYLGLSIVIITLIVRGCLFPFSRKQSANAKIMQEKMAKLNPEIKKIQEQYGSDFQKVQQEKMKLFREHGINPAAQMGGCLLLFAQMPVFMGLYYALQESVFFRLEPFLWMPNLAAPDMLAFWSEKIPWISDIASLGSTFYLGPYFNILPLISVALMMYTQSKMMPKSEDPQVQMQQKMMKIMMVMFALFFYKVAAGLCIYFICSSLWGMFERKLQPKKPPEDEITPASGKGTAEKKKPDEPKTWWERKKAAWAEKMKKIMEEAQKQQEIRNKQTGTKPDGNKFGNKKQQKKKK